MVAYAMGYNMVTENKEYCIVWLAVARITICFPEIHSRICIYTKICSIKGFIVY